MNTNDELALSIVANEDVRVLGEKGKTYGDSWKKRGGVGAFMMLARKWDRIENQCVERKYDIFDCDVTEKDGLLDDISDLRRYLLLVEAELMSRKPVAEYQIPRELFDKVVRGGAGDLLPSSNNPYANIKDAK